MATIAPFPHRYRVQIDDAATLSSGALAPIAGGAPPQFGGDGHHWSPEELLIGAAGLCFVTTFRAVAHHAGLAVASFRCAVDGTLEKSATGPAFSAIRLEVQLGVKSGEEDNARLLLERAKKRCIVANTLKCPVVLESRVEAKWEEGVEQVAP